MTPEVLEFWMPMPPRTTNRASGKSHWRVVHKEKKRYWLELYSRMQQGFHFPKPPAAPICPAWLDATFYSSSRGHFMDRDNRTARLKPVIDFLREHKYIAGDRDEHLYYNIPEQAVFDSINPAPPLCSLHLTLRPWNGTKTG